MQQGTKGSDSMSGRAARASRYRKRFCSMMNEAFPGLNWDHNKQPELYGVHIFAEDVPSFSQSKITVPKDQTNE